jgi:hypothetical protein
MMEHANADLRALLFKHSKIAQRLQLYNQLLEADPENAAALQALRARSESNLVASEALLHHMLVQVAR